MKKRVRVILSAGLGAALLAGCAGPNLVGVGGREMPDWVLDPQVAREAYPEALCGTGMSHGIEDPGLARDTADQHAYIRIAEQLGLQGTARVERRAEARGGSRARAQEAVHAASQRTTQVDMLLKGIEVKRRWVSEKGEWYSLACLSREDLDAATRDLIAERFDHALETSGDAASHGPRE